MTVLVDLWATLLEAAPWLQSIEVYLINVWHVLLNLAPWLLLGSVAAGLLHGLVPRDLIQRHLTGRGGVLKAVLLGVPLPLCSCGVIPAGIGLKKDGASNGAAVGFITATPQTGVDSILVSAGFLGWPFAFAKVGAALVTGIACGLLTDRVSADSYSSEGTCAAVVEDSGSDSGQDAGAVVGEMVEHGVDLIRMIWGWLVFGVLLSAALTTLMPDNELATWTGAGVVGAFVLALLVSLPLYVCATASVPIAASLVVAGMPTGAAMVFLMAGPATNVATLGAVYRAFGVRVVGVYLSTIVIGSAAFGLLYETVIGDVVVGGQDMHEHMSWWAVASAVGLVLMLLYFALEDLSRLYRRRMVSDMVQQHTVSVQGMTCGGCASRLERHLLQVAGVEAVTISLEEGAATVSGQVDVEVIRGAVEQAGFSAA